MTMLSQIGIAIVACLSYNMLLGQGGMLSFGHAVYTGLGTFVAVHALNRVGDGAAIPVSLVPLVGGLAGIVFAVILGYVTTKKAGTPFAMITLGIGELVFAMSLMIPEFFGGEGGVSANRVAGQPLFGITFGPRSRSTTCSRSIPSSAPWRCSRSRGRRSAGCSTRCETTRSGWSSSATTPSACATSRSSLRAFSLASPAACTR